MAPIPRSCFRRSLVLVVFGLVLITSRALAAEESVPGRSVALSGSATVNFAELARRAARLSSLGVPPVRALVPSAELNEMDLEPGASVRLPAPPRAPFLKFPQRAFVVSPSPSLSYIGLDDIPMVDSSYIIIPPDVAGGVGPAKVMETFNNNIRIRDKATGVTQLTIGEATFWNPVVSNKTLLNQLTDPRTAYDPVQGRWLVASQTTNNPGLILFGVSQTSDPAGGWLLYSVSPGFTSAPRLDFPILGFNKNWLVVTINAFNAGGSFVRGGTMIASYPQAAAGTLSSVTNVSQANGTHFCTAPCVTLSATEDTLFLVTHGLSSSATYSVDRITGTATPTYTSGGTNTRPGGAWVNPSGQILPQSAPVSGTSSCGATPCPIETQDAQVRSAPAFRLDSTTGQQFIYYTQTIGLPVSGLTHTAVQWTKITASTTPAFADGGRIEDPTATSSNGGKWYAYPHVAVNSAGDMLIGYSEFSSSEHPSAGYSYHDHADGAGTLRDPFIYKAGEDYYHKTFGGTRDRWGDFSTAQVDPSDDRTLWVLQEYAKARKSTDDGTTGANGSRWSSFWANFTPGAVTFTITASAGANGAIIPSGAVSVAQGASQSFTITPNVCHHVADVLVDGSSVGAVTTFTFNNVQASHTISASFAIDMHTISASAGAGGSISPTGAVSVNCGTDQGFTISPDAGHHVSDVLVDGGSIGAVTSHTFTNVTANHTIAASFAIDSFTVAVTVVGQGSVAKSPNQPHYAFGQSLSLTATPAAGWGFTGWTGDVTSTTNPLPLSISGDVSLTATFADTAAPIVQVLAPHGGDVLAIGSTATLSWIATDNVAVTAVDLLLSRTGAGGVFDSLAVGIANTGSFGWTVTGPATTDAFLQVVAHDAAGHAGSDVSDTAFTITGNLGVGGGGLPHAFGLALLSPHPVRGAAALRFDLPRSAAIRLSVFDPQGREVAVLAQGGWDAGSHEVVWRDGSSPSGLYFVRYTVPGQTFVRRLVRMR